MCLTWLSASHKGSGISFAASTLIKMSVQIICVQKPKLINLKLPTIFDKCCRLRPAYTQILYVERVYRCITKLSFSFLFFILNPSPKSAEAFNCQWLDHANPKYELPQTSTPHESNRCTTHPCFHINYLQNTDCLKVLVF